MPIYEYQHPITEEIFTDIRPFADSHKPFYAPDGTLCEKIISYPMIFDGNADIDSYNDILKSKPKMLKFKDGRKEKLDSRKHGIRKGSESQLRKKPKGK